MLSINKKKLIVQLAQKKQRDQHNLFVAEGAKLASDLVRGGLHPTYVVGLPIAIEPFRAVCTDVNDCTEQELKAISQLKTPSKLIAIFQKPVINVDTDNNLVLVLDDIQDPGNLGTIIRTADWFGLRRIICSKNCADAYNPKTIQATMGAIARVRVEETDLDALFKSNEQGAQLPVYGTFLEGSNIYSTPLTQQGYIIMGNEGKGIATTLQHYVSHKLFIPSYPLGATTSESLNVAAATAIVCSEFRRRTF